MQAFSVKHLYCDRFKQYTQLVPHVTSEQNNKQLLHQSDLIQRLNDGQAPLQLLEKQYEQAGHLYLLNISKSLPDKVFCLTDKLNNGQHLKNMLCK